MENEGLKISEMYFWELETVDGVVLSQYDEEGKERSWKTVELDKIVRASFLPKLPLFPSHDCLIDITKGEKFVSRKGRGIMKFIDNGYKIAEYLQCFTTLNYRLWVFSTSGRCLITNKDYELYF